MNKILVSLCTIAVVAAIGIGATTAYFTSTQASIGNTITAGNLSLQVDSTCHYNGMTCDNGFWKEDNDDSTTVAEPSMLQTACSCTWLAKSLTPTDLFFNYNDVKPGDVGENTVSLHIDNNPAWVCASISNLVAKENGCANNAELRDDSDCATETTGELKNNLLFTVWRDSDCDNILDGTETAIVTNQSASELNWAIADSQNGGQPIPGSTDPSVKTCIGVKWTVPASVNNIIQGDSIQGDITFTAVQSRNNASYTCGQPNTPVAVDGVCGTANKAYASSDESYGADTFCAVGASDPESPAFPAQGGSTSWVCKGTNGGVDAQCSASRGAAPVAGSCGTAATSYAYDATVFSGTMCSTGSGTTDPVSPVFPSQGGITTWTCDGANGGNSSETCTATRALAPVNGVCSSDNGGSHDMPTNLCVDGNATTPTGTHHNWTWTCDGINGGTNAQCPVINGVCGTANNHIYRKSDTTYGFWTQCSSGTPSSTAFPVQGGSTSWTCNGINGGLSSPTCSASHSDHNW